MTTKPTILNTSGRQTFTFIATELDWDGAEQCRVATPADSEPEALANLVTFGFYPPFYLVGVVGQVPQSVQRLGELVV